MTSTQQPSSRESQYPSRGQLSSRRPAWTFPRSSGATTRHLAQPACFTPCLMRRLLSQKRRIVFSRALPYGLGFDTAPMPLEAGVIASDFKPFALAFTLDRLSLLSVTYLLFAL